MYGCMYFLAALVLVCVDVMVMSAAHIEYCSDCSRRGNPFATVLFSCSTGTLSIPALFSTTATSSYSMLSL